ncbi:MAG TPA: class I SAM-dependent methyltransferase [Alphaproteobacteria bacterium]|nr:class I SAM-dependent methyltransferase [Alphaproteobacteria bacterium]
MTEKIYDRIAPLYDLLDSPFEYSWRGRLRARMFDGLSGRILDAGIGTGRNIPHYPKKAATVGIDASAGMLEQAQRRSDRLGSKVELLQRDITNTRFPDASFDAIVSTFVFCVLEDDQQLPALRELRRLCKPGGTIRLLDYTLSARPMTKLLMRTLERASNRLFAARYDVRTEAYLEPANLTTVDRRLVFGDMVRFLELRPAEPGDAPAHRLSSADEPQTIGPQPDAFPATAG